MVVRRRLALITGASAGIGAAFARGYAGAGFDVALSARRRDRLEALADEIRRAHDVETVILPADLGEADGAARLLAGLQASGRHADVLVNNAGYGLPGNWLDSDWDDHARFVQVMLTAPLELSHALLPAMVERRWGRIVTIASLAGYAPVSGGHTLYGAVKSALIKFSQSLHAELSGTGVHATAVCPGLTLTEFHDVNGTRSGVSKVPGLLWQSADEVARIGMRASERNRAVVVTGVANKLIAGLSKMLPDEAGVALAGGATRRYRKQD